MNNKRYQHILFDLDGTLTDPMIGITSSVKYALSYFNIEVEEGQRIFLVGKLSFKRIA